MAFRLKGFHPHTQQITTKSVARGSIFGVKEFSLSSCDFPEVLIRLKELNIKILVPYFEGARGQCAKLVFALFI